MLVTEMAYGSSETTQVRDWQIHISSSLCVAATSMLFQDVVKQNAIASLSHEKTEIVMDKDSHFG